MTNYYIVSIFTVTMITVAGKKPALPLKKVSRMSKLTELLAGVQIEERSDTPSETTPTIITGPRGHRNRRFTIAILTRSRIAGIREVIKGLTEHMHATAPGQFSFVWFSSDNDEKRLMDQASHVIRNYTIPYDAVVTIGGQATQVASRMALLLNIRIPIIFTSITHPSHLGILYAGSNGRQNITGVAVDEHEYSAPVAVLQLLKKTAKNILLPYDPHGQGYQRVLAMSQSFLLNDIQAHILPIQKSDPLERQISPYIHNVDTIITPRDQTILSQISSVISLCNTFGVTVFSTDLASVKQGAAIGLSPKENIQGIEAAKYLVLIFKESIRPEELPVTEISITNYLGINESALERQGISFSSGELETIENKIVYTEENDKKETSQNNGPTQEEE